MFTLVDTKMKILDKKYVNLIENAAIFLAAESNSPVSPIQLIPYFSLTVEELDKCLNDMVDGHSIIKLIEDELTVYEFKNISKNLLTERTLTVTDIQFEDKLIEKTKLEHQIIHAASLIKGRVSAESLAANSDFTLNEVKDVLQTLSLRKYISQGLDEDNGSIYYRFPELEYPDNCFKKNMFSLNPKDPVESFDAKMAVFFKYMFICLIMLCLLFVAKVNFRFLIILFLASIPFSAFMTILKTKN